MKFQLDDEHEAWRSDIRAFLDESMDPELAADTEYDDSDRAWEYAVHFTQQVAKRGWIAVSWPSELGGLGKPPIFQAILLDEFEYYAAPFINRIGWGQAASVLVRHGTAEQRAQFLPGIANCTDFWAEGLTEPESGSDLASLKTTAVKDGDGWRISGQKTFTTWGHRSDYLWLAARTDPQAPKHQSISVFCVPLRDPGVTLTPMWNLGGGRQNHTFLDEVRVPGGHLLGSENEGWNYIIGNFYGGTGRGAGTYRRTFELLLEYCRESTPSCAPLMEDRVVRHKLAELAIGVETMQMLTYERFSRMEHGHKPVLAGAIGPVVYKELMVRFADLCLDIIGPLSQIRSGKWAPLAGRIETVYRRSFSNHAGGTPQVKRMVLATRGLGLPR